VNRDLIICLFISLPFLHPPFLSCLPSLSHLLSLTSCPSISLYTHLDLSVSHPSFCPSPNSCHPTSKTGCDSDSVMSCFAGLGWFCAQSLALCSLIRSVGKAAWPPAGGWPVGSSSGSPLVHHTMFVTSVSMPPPKQISQPSSSFHSL
jgi:hypothetical protein